MGGAEGKGVSSDKGIIDLYRFPGSAPDKRLRDADASKLLAFDGCQHREHFLDVVLNLWYCWGIAPPGVISRFRRLRSEQCLQKKTLVRAR